MFQHHEVQHSSEEVESTSLQEIRKGEGNGKEELPNQVCCSGIEQVHQVPVLIDDPVLLPRLLCSLLGAFRGRGEVVNRLVLLPSTELVSDLYAVLRCCHCR